MTRIALIVAPGATLSSVMITLDMINIACRYPEAEACRLDLLSSSGGEIQLSAAVKLTTQNLPDSLDHYAAVIVPGFFAENIESLHGQLHAVCTQPVQLIGRTAQESGLGRTQPCARGIIQIAQQRRALGQDQRARTSRSGGVCLRSRLILRCRSALVAWFGGSVYTEKKPLLCPVRRLVATMRIQLFRSS